MVIGRELSGLNKVIMDLYPIRLSRPMTRFVRKRHKNDNERLVGVEIGTAEGFNALNMLRVLPIKRLYLVDSYEGDWDVLFDKSKNLLKSYGDRAIFVRKKSADAVDDIPTDLDFVYIDANHDYEFVKQDFDLYYPKVKNGGVIGGHDFGLPWVGVCRFVLDLVDHFGVDNVFTDKKDWWMVKDNKKKTIINKKSK